MIISILHQEVSSLLEQMHQQLPKNMMMNQCMESVSYAVVNDDVLILVHQSQLVVPLPDPFLVVNICIHQPVHISLIIAGNLTTGLMSLDCSGPS